MYCCEDISLIENYDKAISDNTQSWRCHHRLEIQDDGKIIYTAKQLQDMGLYYNRPASELIFLTLSEHNSLHAKYVPIDRRIRVSNKLKERQPHPQSEETRKKLSELNKGKKLSKECKLKISNKLKGRKYSKEELEHHKASWTDEKRKEVSIRFKGKPKSEEVRKLMSESSIKRSTDVYKLNMSISVKNSEKYKQAMAKRKGEKCWNNGVITVRSKEQPEGFIPGRLKKN
jgi:hypothetical protein